MDMHHIGIIVRDLDSALETYKKMGYIQESEIVVDNIQNILVAFLIFNDCTHRIELIQAIDSRSSIYNFKEGLHHICYNIKKNVEIECFKQMKIGKIFTKPIVAKALNDKKVIFALMDTGVFIEFIL